MWEYKVVTGTFQIEGPHVKVRNPAGEGYLPVILDHYGAERWELVTLHLDVTQNLVAVLKRPKDGAAPAAEAGSAAAAQAAVPAQPAAGAPRRRSGADLAALDDELPRRRSAPGTGSPGSGRRNKADLDRLARED